MSTRSYIGIVNPDRSVSFIYCHHDGNQIGETLEAHYSNPRKVIALIALGDISTLYSEVAPATFQRLLLKEENFTETMRERLLEAADFTVSYKLWRDDECPAQTAKTIEEFEDRVKAGESGIEYAYLFHPDLRLWKAYNVY